METQPEVHGMCDRESKRPRDLARKFLMSHMKAAELLRTMEELNFRIEAAEAEGDAALRGLLPYLKDGERVLLLVDSFWRAEGPPPDRWAKWALEVQRRGDRVLHEVHPLVLPDQLRLADPGREDDEALAVGLRYLDTETA